MAPERGYPTKEGGDFGDAIYLCSGCNPPTFFRESNGNLAEQVPAPAMGSPVGSLPENVQAIYEEAGRSTSVAACTCAVMACRTLVMHIAVNKGANEGLTFAGYVDYLAGKGYVPPDGKAWVEQIRDQGNEAVHEIVVKSRNDANKVLGFVEMLLRFIYEFPAKVGGAPAVAEQETASEAEEP